MRSLLKAAVIIIAVFWVAVFVLFVSSMLFYEDLAQVGFLVNIKNFFGITGVKEHIGDTLIVSAAVLTPATIVAYKVDKGYDVTTIRARVAGTYVPKPKVEKAKKASKVKAAKDPKVKTVKVPKVKAAKVQTIGLTGLKL